jgi:hypothetical protein
MRELESVRTQIDVSEPWATLAGPDPIEWYVDVEHNVVAVGVVRITPELTAAAVRTFGPLVALFATTHTAPYFSSRQDDFEPWVAGSRISSPNTNGCTTGYVIRNVFTNQTGLVTAGHCARLGDTVFNNGDPIGTVLYRTYTNNGPDFAMIGGQTYEPWAYTGPWNSQTGEAIRGAHQAIIGDLLCFDGSYTGENCSARVDAQNLCLRLNTGITTCGLNRAKSTNNTRLGQNGDSGGPVYGINGGIKMSGIIITGSSDGLTGYFQNVLVPGGPFVPPGWQLAYVP